MNGNEVVRFEEIRVGQYFQFQGDRYKKVALAMARDDARIGTVFHAKTEVVPGPMDPTHVSVQLRERAQART